MFFLESQQVWPVVPSFAAFCAHPLKNAAKLKTPRGKYLDSQRLLKDLRYYIFSTVQILYYICNTQLNIQITIHSLLDLFQTL